MELDESEPAFDPKVFLSKVSKGLSISEYPENKVVYKQGDPADSVFYVRRGKAKVTVISEQERKQSYRFSDHAFFSVKDAWQDRFFVWQQ
jgi:CRP/FNR family transcriptional regulator, cyclic AMP receptor protein